MDLDAAIGLAGEFQEPAAVIIKHTNPCGTAIGEDILAAFRKAHDADPVSAFGSVIAMNREVNGACAQAVASGFVEALVATSFTSEALEIFQSKKNLRLLELSDLAGRDSYWRSVAGGLLMQDADSSMEERSHCRVMSRRQPTEAEWKDLFFAWRVVKHVKSNAIVLAHNGVTSGVGAGQMSRVDSAELAARKAGERAQGAVLASDAFFPFRDGLDVAARAGITAAIEPGGSMRDDEVITAADEHGIALVFTGVRHFRH
jgi:phosphoribosylaminoimidazolecarboxamide formyltransferase/IMP cyclohydrolase